MFPLIKALIPYNDQLNMTQDHIPAFIDHYACDLSISRVWPILLSARYLSIFVMYLTYGAFIWS